jgi:hypothetical protein
MNPQIAIALMLGLLGPVLAAAQEVEPGVQTSSAAAAAQPGASPPPAATSTVPVRRPLAAQTSGVQTTGAQTAGAQAAGAGAEKTKPAGSPAGKSSDRVQLDTTQISGNQELPKVMYVVPWRRATPGDFAGKPPNSLLDEALTPVDRDVFKRQNRYYGVVQDQSQATTADPRGKDEK